MRLQVHRFPDGGGVIHRIPWRGGRLSAWFGPDFRVLNVEAFNRSGRGVRSGAAAREEAARWAPALRRAIGGAK